MSVMTMIAGGRGRAAVSLGAAIRLVFASVAKEWRARREVAYLIEMDERMLADIGVNRGDLMRAVRGRYY
jgi:uncharacterized protein YjiS (DUF1127 family)